MRVVALAGGTGSAKLLRGLASITGSLTVVANVGDNYWYHGLYVCPDVDVATYSLAGISDVAKGWGIAGDSFEALGQLRRLGAESWFKLGDRDMAVSLVRTELLNAGYSLTEATLRLIRALGVSQLVLPATDTPMETWMRTGSGRMHLQEYWVKNRGRPRVEKVQFIGASGARPTPLVREAISRADRVVVCPANPVTSIGPILAIGGMRRLLASSRARVVALSPMVGRGPYSGPAGRLMRQLGIRPDSAGVASLYADFAEVLLVHEGDAGLSPRVEAVGVECLTTNTLMRTRADERRVAREVLRA